MEGHPLLDRFIVDTERLNLSHETVLALPVGMALLGLVILEPALEET